MDAVSLQRSSLGRLLLLVPKSQLAAPSRFQALGLQYSWERNSGEDDPREALGWDLDPGLTLWMPITQEPHVV